MRPGSDEDSTTEPVASLLSRTGPLVLLSYFVDGFLKNSLLPLILGPGDYDVMARRIPPPSKI